MTQSLAGAVRARPARSPWAVLSVLCLGLFMILLDGTIVNVAIPKIMAGLNTGLAGVEWVMNGYVLMFAVTLVTLGRLGDLYGRRLLFVAGMALFTLSSLACGLAPNIGLLVAFRVVQGLGGAAMMQVADLLTKLFQVARRYDARSAEINPRRALPPPAKRTDRCRLLPSARPRSSKTMR